MNTQAHSVSMLRYYGKDKAPFECETIIERRELLAGRQTRKYESVDELYIFLRQHRYEFLQNLVERDEFMVTDVNIWLCEIIFKDPEEVRFILEECYRKSFKKQCLIYEAVVFFRNHNHIIAIRNSDDFLLYWKEFLCKLCSFYPDQMNRLTVCGGIAPMHAVLQMNEFIRAETLEILMENGGDINVRDRFGATPLHHAAWDNCEDNYEMLLEHGADRFVKDNDGKTACDYAIEQGNFKAAKRLRLTKQSTITGSNKRWKAYEEIQCMGGPLEFSQNIVDIPIEPDTSEFISSLIASNNGSDNLSLSPDALAELRVEATAMMGRIAEIVKEYDPRFEFQPLLTGSMAQGGKVKYPDEFDYSCILTRFSALCKDVAEEQYPGYCKLVQTTEIPLEFAEFFDKGSFNFKKVNTRLYELIEKALTVIHLHGFSDGNPTMIFINPPYRQLMISAIAYEMFFMCNSKNIKNLKIKVDLAAALSLKPQSFCLKPFLNIDECMFVHVDDNNVAGVSCRISMTLQENAIFQSFPTPMIKSYGLLKSLISLLISWALPQESVSS